MNKPSTALTLCALGALLGVALATPARAQTTPRPEPAQAALTQLLSAHPQARYIPPSVEGGPALLVGLAEPTQGQDAAARALDFIQRRASALRISADQLRVAQVRQAAGQQVVLFEQVHGQLPVLGRHMAVTLDAQGKVLTVTHNVLPIQVALKGQVSAQEASAIAQRHVHGDALEVPLATGYTRVILAQPGQIVEAWEIALPMTPTLLQPRVLISTLDGAVLSTRDLARR